VKDPRLLHLHENRLELGPETVHFDLTNGCNTNCITCWDHSPLLTLERRKPSEWKRKRVTRGSVAAVLADLHGLGGHRAVILSGMGDPLTHPDIYGFIEDVKVRGLHCTIITNLIPADAERIHALDVDELLIGIHGASLASYLAFHPNFRPAEWEKLHHMLALFRARGRRYKHVQVISRVNAHELSAMCELAAKYEAKQVNFKLASLGGGTEAAQITEEQRRDLLERDVGRAEARARELGVLTNLGVFRAQLGAADLRPVDGRGDGDGSLATAPIDAIGCFMGHYYARILVDGTVLYCCNTEVAVGSLQDAPFSALWRGEAWSALRKRMREGRYFESCRQCGKVNQNVKLAARFEKQFGRDAYLAVTGR
jgi:MoaA/NifB/PqqE/SkfB family radical SAM enzyme